MYREGVIIEVASLPNCNKWLLNQGVQSVLSALWKTPYRPIWDYFKSLAPHIHVINAEWTGIWGRCSEHQLGEHDDGVRGGTGGGPHCPSMGTSVMVSRPIGAFDRPPAQAAFMARPASPVMRQASPPGTQNIRSSLMDTIQWAIQAKAFLE
jgi:hypothetical protein